MKTSVCNIVIKNGLIDRWYFSWENNQITAYTYLRYDVENPSDIFERTRITADLVLLIDVLTLITNQDVNTSIVISTDPVIDIFIGQITNKSNSVDQFSNEIKSLRHQLNASCLNRADEQRIESSKLQMSDEALTIIYTLLFRLTLINIYSKEFKKLVNYWRKGADLNHLQFIDESFLSYYKVIEYISKKAKLHKKNIPAKYLRTTSLTTAYKFAAGAKLKKLTQTQYQMLSEFIDIRNNWDIAHTKIRPLPKPVARGLYYSYMGDRWNYHSHICQITRITLLRECGLTGLSLINDGGLYILTCK
ncbi:hypothetical protein KBA63_01085 [Candidatus Woesebacteria bacterium]|nr:hypothetical protein [Candidatus Woesebacteria bacterium]